PFPVGYDVLVWFAAVAEDEPLAGAGGLAVVELDRLVVGRRDLVDEVPDAVARKPADPVRRRHILRGEGRAVVPLDAGAELYLVGVAVLLRGLREPEVPLRVDPAVDRQRRDEEVGVDAAAEDRVRREEVPVTLRREHVRPAAVELAAFRATAPAAGRSTCGRREIGRAHV